MSSFITCDQGIYVRVAVKAKVNVRLGKVQAVLLEDHTVPHLTVDLAQGLIGVVVLEKCTGIGMN